MLNVKYIIISGGVLSGLGKGIITASLGLLLKSRGFKVTAFKCDMYLNIDAGTMNPLEHGEVFVTHDGLETDQDLGHYERFIDETLSRSNYATNGQIYKSVLDKERSLEYKGACVQPYHHIPPEIIKRWEIAGREHKSDIVLIEMGGTVGEYEGLLFFEAARRLKLKNPNDISFIHVGYLPAPGNIGELKSKPLQQSVYFLNTMGIQPDFIVGRASKEVDTRRKEKIALASGVPIENIISSPDLDSVYKVPLKLDEQGFAELVFKKLGLKAKKKNLTGWIKLVNKINSVKKYINIAIVGKYQKTGDYVLEDAYVSVIESLKHAGWNFSVNPRVKWVNSEDLEKVNDEEVKDIFEDINGIIVPQGWGIRGVEGKIKAVKFARENKIPYLGLCFGMQMAVIEFARNVLGLKHANSEEVDPESPYKVIHLMDKQKDYLEKNKYGGTIRLGAWPCVVKKGTILESAYKKYGGVKSNPWYQPNPTFPLQIRNTKYQILVYERHRHRYEFNNEYKDKYEKNGLLISGLSPDGELVEAIELKDHPFFIGTQFHPEYISRPLSPHPIFLSFLEACLKK
ncbi:CTP synthetase [Candidatus Woesebacteria bacterium RBG_13_36_22]|uniref:CTP synthase (glutamine hydrolyzing) n=1 Tax=Candidatus Woesebacteria bacterium RBG_13_36_22 TaxID=1802478 RepID=A0A1F7X205_9BACT|nr:MAG: CTP synthetase [Candidatus Woesebacteria bacterium RBG_13_36_22]